ncbi:hypothetical protein GOV14_00065 [Candidatus Pacearchaeota archaeon]|nr:hypothetical protein [Candidatus Pacearchaeota archaeon]
MGDLELVPKSVIDEPIRIPENPFWEVFKRFGRDELIAMFVNVIATVIIGIFTAIPILLALAGPVIEKIGFFPGNFWEAKKIYKTTPKKQRKRRFFYFRGAIKRGSKSLLEDILIHDPLYILFMFVGLLVYPGTPIWLLSTASFIIAVIIVTFLEVGINEVRYIKLKNKLKRAGFESERYYETRFFISSQENPKKLMEKITKTFNVVKGKQIGYHDKYLDNNFSTYSGRVPRVRLRLRNNDAIEKGWLQTVQIVYTKAREKGSRAVDQYRYFPIRKTKFYYLLNQKMPKKISEIKNKKIKRVLRHSKSKICDVNFERQFAKNEHILFSIDKILKGKDYYVLEIKVRKNRTLLMEAMRYVMQEFPVAQTTSSKCDL